MIKSISAIKPCIWKEIYGSDSIAELICSGMESSYERVCSDSKLYDSTTSTLVTNDYDNITEHSFNVMFETCKIKDYCDNVNKSKKWILYEKQSYPNLKDNCLICNIKNDIINTQCKDNICNTCKEGLFFCPLCKSTPNRILNKSINSKKKRFFEIEQLSVVCSKNNCIIARRYVDGVISILVTFEHDPALKTNLHRLSDNVVGFNTDPALFKIQLANEIFKESYDPTYKMFELKHKDLHLGGGIFLILKDRVIFFSLSANRSERKVENKVRKNVFDIVFGMNFDYDRDAFVDLKRETLKSLESLSKNVKSMKSLECTKVLKNNELQCLENHQKRLYAEIEEVEISQKKVKTLLLDIDNRLDEVKSIHDDIFRVHEEIVLKNLNF